MKRLFFLITILLLVPLVSMSQSVPNAYRPFEIGWNVLSYSKQGQVSLYGGDLSFVYHGTPGIGVVADIAVHRSSDLVPQVDTVTYRFGPRFTGRLNNRLNCFGEALFGGSRLMGSAALVSGSSTIKIEDHWNGFAAAAGGGLDIALTKWLTVRAIQADYSVLRFKQLDATSTGFRAGGGIVFRFGHIGYQE